MHSKPLRPRAPARRVPGRSGRGRIGPAAAPLLLAAAALGLVGLPGTASAQSAADIMADARAAWESRAEGIESYTVVQRTMGTESTTYFERDEIDGIVVFRPQSVTGDPSSQVAEEQFDEAFFMRDEVARRMAYEGTQEVEGHACHQLVLDDFEGLDVGGTAFGDQRGSEIETMRMCLDTGSFVPRRLQMRGTASMGGESRPVESTVLFSDYREVEGLLHPFRMEMTVSGLGLDAEQQGQMAEAMARLEEQLEQLPEAERERMRSMMESRMGAMEGIMGVARGEPMVVETVEVRVNEGPPAGGP